MPRIALRFINDSRHRRKTAHQPPPYPGRPLCQLRFTVEGRQLLTDEDGTAFGGLL